ncbi:GNAT family N-acetyltransferase [Paraburkholderia sp. 22099]|uniref:GNAT family N-acetyltransferase n=1 Tax=Paraburkholderia TaxID=1822464 RepID=UPI0013564491|nr:GNAT family N-acetyltransferase [Paraburkholderia terricola]MDR6495855.1 ElaA protein [Paraburkholderia terricola]
MEAVAASASHSVNARADAVAWRWSSFEQLPVAHLYAAISLRESIFVVEQNVPYLDADGRDPHCRHLTGFVDGRLVAYARVLPKDLFEPGFFSFGRVVVHPEHRHAGIGRELVTLALAHLDEVRGNTPVKISSQFYLREFYQSFGFAPQGEPYIEDRILHIGMVRGHSSPGGRP